jgi:hypothetical protein
MHVLRLSVRPPSNRTRKVPGRRPRHKSRDFEHYTHKYSANGVPAACLAGVQLSRRIIGGTNRTEIESLKAWETAMELTREAKIFAAIILLVVPTVQYGGLAILGMLTHGAAGTGAAEAGLNAGQLALFRAGHAHAGVWLILSLVIQVLLDAARLPSSTKWLARIAAPVGTLALSGGFFGMVLKLEFRFLLYFGALAMLCSLILTGIGLLRNLSAAGPARTVH